MMNNPIKKCTILCVDDDVDDLVLLREAVTDASHKCSFKEVYNGKEALDYLHQARHSEDLPCLIILDINMPILNGKEMLAIIKNDDVLKKIPTVVFTTSSSSEDKKFCSSFSTDMVSKPIYFEELKHIVQQLLVHYVPALS